MAQHLLIIGFVVIFMLITVALSVGVAWISLRDEVHAPAAFRDDAEAEEA